MKNFNSKFFIDKGESIKLFMQHALTYNKEFYYKNASGDTCVKWKGAELLKKTHFDVFEVLLFLLINKNDPEQRTNIDDLCSVSTSRAEILNLYSRKAEESEMRPINPRKITIWRHIKRLMKAGIIEEKTKVKGTSLFRLKLSCNILKINDLSVKSNSIFSTPSISGVCPERVSKLNLHLTPKEKIEKSNSETVDKKESGQRPDELTKTSNPTQTGNTGRDVENQPDKQKKKEGAGADFSANFFDQQARIQGLIEKEANRGRRSILMVEREKYNAVLSLYKRILGTVFTEKRTTFYTHGEVVNYPFRFKLNLTRLNVHAEHNEALRVLLTYFNRAKSYQEIELLSDQLYKSAELARRAILHKKMNIDFLTPSKFLRRGKFSLANVFNQWLPTYLERERAVKKKIEKDQCSIQQAQERVRFQYEADLLLTEILENKTSITRGLQYMNQNYTQTFKNWFVDLVHEATSGQYTPKAKAKTKEQKEFIQKVFYYEDYISENESKLLHTLAQKTKKVYFKDLHEFIDFKDNQTRRTPVAVRDYARFQELAYKHLLFNPTQL